MDLNEEIIESVKTMDDFKKKSNEVSVKFAIKLVRVMQIFKWLLAVVVCYAYFTESPLLIESILISIIIILISPFGFFASYIQALLEYNTSAIEGRQLLNANEANAHFEKVYKKIEELEMELDVIKADADEYRT